MKKTFYLGVRQWVYILMGVLFIVNGVANYFKEELNTVEYWLMLINLVFGTMALIYGLIVSFDLLGLAAKVVVSNDSILLKAKPFSASKVVAWNDIRSITFHSYQLDFKLDTAPIFFNYHCSNATSIKLKDAIRDMADLKNIEVKGG